MDAVDDWLGRLMDEVPDDMFVFVLGDIGIALGEHDYLGRGTPTSHRCSYEIPYLIRHPRGEKAGDDIDWYASTHDVAPTLLSPPGPHDPRQDARRGPDALFDGVDQEDLPDRPFSITASGSLIMVRDKRWLMVADREQMERRLYDDDEEADDDDIKKRYDDVAERRARPADRHVAGGADGGRRHAARVRPGRGAAAAARARRRRHRRRRHPQRVGRRRQRAPRRRRRAEALQWDGRDPEDRTGPRTDRSVTEATETRRNPSTEFLYANKWRIFGVMMIGWAMSLLDISIVNISIPTLETEMSTDVATSPGSSTPTTSSFAILLVSMGRLADQFGRKRFFIIGLTVFTIGSALCAAAWSIEWLIVFRVIQGVGAGILAPLGFAITVLVFPPEQRGRGLALIAVVALVSSALGPVLGGVLVDVASWHWIFLINIPFGVLGVVLCLRWWPETWDLSAGREVDVRGMVLLGARRPLPDRRAGRGEPVRRRPARSGSA